jgi:hypothetical protein
VSRKHRLPLPEILQRPMSPAAVRDGGNKKRWAAVIAHFGLEKDANRTFAATDDAQAKEQARLRFFEGLALRLLVEYIPAFSRSRPGRRPTQVDQPWKVWGDAGGSREDYHRENMAAFYQAQFVMAIEGLKQERGRSRAWVFRWLANEEELASPKVAAQRRDLLPPPYRNRTTAGALKEAFAKIPREVRKSPHRFLPGGDALKPGLTPSWMRRSR